VPMEGRGRRFEEMLDTVRLVWAGAEVGSAGVVGPDVSDDPPPLILGGQVDATFRRTATYADGWMMGGGPAEAFRGAVEKLESAWREAGRDGEPRKLALGYFSLDDDPEGQSRQTIGHYYRFLGDYADQIVAGVAKGADEVSSRVRDFAEAGADELILFPASSNPEQVDRLAAAVL
jgi:alkanesulfonate monooxygenase SsuD/methylene tetrahydromethanopterin reductase-like flavin-dependent oxidoreductase (luciferase family)